MDTLLLGITGISLLAAGVSTAVAWKVTRAERRRRLARVAALAAASGMGTPPSPPAVRPTSNEQIADAVPTRALLGVDPWDSGSRGRQRVLLGGVATCAGVLLVAAAVWLFGGPSSGATPGMARVPVELVSLGHERVDGAFAVNGVVRNPATGSTLHELEADVRVFDPAGIVIATSAARISLADLAPGQEAPFALRMGEAQTAARYRVSFRSGGTMVPHVDRRANAPATVSRTADAR